MATVHGELKPPVAAATAAGARIASDAGVLRAAD
uniref:Uncharacterized protein n=1 Tax=Arundo donax TaxID=35708 RepID=A0A0A8ZE92_ARUDO